MFCPKCGNQMPDGVKFCPKCGNAIQRDDPAQCAGGGTKVSGQGNRPKINIPPAASSKQMGIAETVAERAGKLFLQKVQNVVSAYLGHWKNLDKKDQKGKLIWLGLHGGGVLALILILTAVSVSHAQRTQNDVLELSSAGEKDHADVKELKLSKKTVKKLLEDFHLDEGELYQMAISLHSYEDYLKLEEYFDQVQSTEEFKNGFREWLDQALDQADGTPVQPPTAEVVLESCIAESELGKAAIEYSQWRDRDGLTGKLIGETPSNPMISWLDNGAVSFSDYDSASGSMRQDGMDHEEIDWYAFSGSNELTLCAVSWDTGERTILLQGSYEISEQGEIVFSAEGEEYRFSQADTDIQARKNSRFIEVAGGVSSLWEYDAFYDMIRSQLGGWDGELDGTPGYITVGGPRTSYDSTIVIWGSRGEILRTVPFRQEEGNSVTITMGGSSITVQYEKVDGKLSLTVNGETYRLASVSQSSGVVAPGANPFGNMDSDDWF